MHVREKLPPPVHKFIVKGSGMNKISDLPAI